MTEQNFIRGIRKRIAKLDKAFGYFHSDKAAGDANAYMRLLDAVSDLRAFDAKHAPKCTIGHGNPAIRNT
jgi:hypothetical protein